MRELGFDLRRNLSVILVKVLVLAILGTVGSTLLAFTRSTAEAVNRSLSEDAEVDLYSLVDSLSDPDAFEQFRRSPEQLRTLDAFYNELDAHPDLAFLSVFNQPMPVHDFSGGIEFDYGYGSDLETRGPYTDEYSGRELQTVKSIQLNAQAFDFFHLRADDGAVIDWDDIAYRCNRVPVLLGRSYHDVYRVGDNLEADFYGEHFTFEVAGFLAERSSVYFKGTMDLFLDDYIVIPYPAKLGDLIDQGEQFRGILSFAMIGGEIAVPVATPSDTVVRALDGIAGRTGFSDYALLNAPGYLVQFAQLRALLGGNVLLVSAIVAAMGFVVLVLASAASYWLFRRRIAVFAVRSRQGAEAGRLYRSLAGALAVEYALVIGAVAIASAGLPIAVPGIVLTAVLALLALGALDVVCQTAAVKRFLRRDESGMAV